MSNFIEVTVEGIKTYANVDKVRAIAEVEGKCLFMSDDGSVTELEESYEEVVENIRTNRDMRSDK